MSIPYYVISTGELFDTNGSPVGTGYSGNGEGLNNPAACDQHNVGPIPPGTYSVGKPITSPHMGPCAIPLAANPCNTMHGRSGFYCHGGLVSDTFNDGAEAPASPQQSASDGCIIMPHSVRTIVATWTVLEVVAT